MSRAGLSEGYKAHFCFHGCEAMVIRVAPPDVHNVSKLHRPEGDAASVQVQNTARSFRKRAPPWSRLVHISVVVGGADRLWFAACQGWRA